MKNPRRKRPGASSCLDNPATHSQGGVAENYEQRGKERASNDVSEPVETKIQPADGNDQHSSNHQRCEQGPQRTAPSDPDAHGDDSEQRAGARHVPGRKRMVIGTQ